MKTAKENMTRMHYLSAVYIDRLDEVCAFDEFIKERIWFDICYTLILKEHLKGMRDGFPEERT